MERIIWFVTLISSIVLMVNQKNHVLSDQPNSDSLSKLHKSLIWILCLLNPILAGAILYYGWRKKLPTKAQQANRISWTAVAIEVVLGGLLFFLTQGR